MESKAAHTLVTVEKVLRCCLIFVGLSFASKPAIAADIVVDKDVSRCASKAGCSLQLGSAVCAPGDAQKKFNNCFECPAAEKAWREARKEMGDACAKSGLSGKDYKTCYAKYQDCHNGERASGDDEDSSESASDRYKNCPSLASLDLASLKEECADATEKHEKYDDKFQELQDKMETDLAEQDEKIQELEEKIQEAKRTYEDTQDKIKNSLDEASQKILADVIQSGEMIKELTANLDTTAKQYQAAILKTQDGCLDQAKKLIESQRAEYSKRYTAGKGKTGDFYGFLQNFSGGKTRDEKNVEAAYVRCLNRAKTEFKIQADQYNLAVATIRRRIESLDARQQQGGTNLTQVQTKAIEDSRKLMVRFQEDMQKMVMALFQKRNQRQQKQARYQEMLTKMSGQGNSPMCTLFASLAQRDPDLATAASEKGAPKNCTGQLQILEDSKNKVCSSYNEARRKSGGQKVEREDVDKVYSAGGEVAQAATQVLELQCEGVNKATLQADQGIDSSSSPKNKKYNFKPAGSRTEQ